MECVRTDLTERDPITDAVVARGGMLFIGILFIVFTEIFQLILKYALQGTFTSAGDAIDVWEYFTMAIATFAALPLIALMKHILVPSEKKTLKGEIFHQFSIYSVTRKDWARQLKHALLMWLIVFVPLDFLSYLIPGMLDFQKFVLYTPPSQESLGSGLYFTIPIFGMFIGFSILVHLGVAIHEETLYRGVLQFWGQEKAGMTSAMVISAIVFGLSHFSYWFSNMDKPIYFPLWWGASGLFVGLMLGFYLRATGHILPMILAHWWNNVVSTIAVWMFLPPQNVADPMATLGWVLYLPLMLLGVVLLLVCRRTLDNTAKLLKKEITSYRNQPSYLIFLDVLFGLGIWLVLLLLG